MDESLLLLVEADSPILSPPHHGLTAVLLRLRTSTVLDTYSTLTIRPGSTELIADTVQVSTTVINGRFDLYDTSKATSPSPLAVAAGVGGQGCFAQAFGNVWCYTPAIRRFYLTRRLVV